MKQEIKILILLLILTFTLNYKPIDSFLIKNFENSEIGIVERVIDGDTIVINGTSVRLLGINSPEKGEKYYLESKQFLEEKILDKEVKIYFGKDRFDKYRRKLGYVFLNTENLNLLSIKEGYSSFYFPSGKDKYYPKFVEAWENCLIKNIYLCEKSKDKCIILKEWNIREQKIILQNICNKEINLNGWSVKDEGRKKYVFEQKIIRKNEEIILTSDDWEEDYVWTNSGDSIFIRDNEDKLVFFDYY